jgi:hypothetical protein
VVTGEDTSNGDGWLGIGTSWFQHRDGWPAMPVNAGPSEWQRVKLGRVGEQKTNNSTLARVAPIGDVKATPLPEVTVSNTRTGDDFISFDVDKIGVPVLVKSSYFPNWKVSGAKGPYRVAPNLMVVVPTSTSVRLHYGFTGLDLFSYVLTALGLIGLVVLWRLGPVSYANRSSRRDDDATVDAEPTVGEGADVSTNGGGYDEAPTVAMDDDPPPWTGPPQPESAAWPGSPPLWPGGGDGPVGGHVTSTPPAPHWADQPPSLGPPLPPPRPEPEP